MLRKKLLFAGLFFSITGASLALYATKLTFKLTVSGVIDPGGCSFNDWITCDTVLSTATAKMFGVPVAWWGFLFYLWSFVVILFAIINSSRPFGYGCAKAVLFISVISVVFTFFKIYQLISLGVICPVCVGMYLSNFGIFFFLLMSLKIKLADVLGFEANYFKSIFKKKDPGDQSPHSLRFGVIFIWMFAMGYFGLKYYENTIVELNPSRVKLILNEHYKQKQVNIKTDNAPVTGNTDAKVKVVVFSDFQCPSCKLLSSNMKTILLDSRNDFSFYYMNYPLDSSINKNVDHRMHEFAGIAALAGVCAARYGKFWEFHDELYENQTRLDREFLLETALNLGMDKNEFEACIDSEEARNKVITDIDIAKKIGVTGTPAMYIDGRKVRYWNSPEIVRAIINEELRNQNK